MAGNRWPVIIIMRVAALVNFIRTFSTHLQIIYDPRDCICHGCQVDDDIDSVVLYTCMMYILDMVHTMYIALAVSQNLLYKPLSVHVNVSKHFKLGSQLGGL